MTNYSGVQLVKQESCKLTYATFLSDVVVCYDKVVNELVLNNPFFYETVYDIATKTLSNSAFSIRKVDLVSSFGAQLVVGLDLNNTGLELILKADEYTRKQVIPYRHLTTCDSLPCYDFGEDFPFCKSILYEGKNIWPCLGADRELVITDKNLVTIEDNCVHFACYDFSKTLDRELNFTEKVVYNGETIWECWDKSKPYDKSTGNWIEGGPILGVFEFFEGSIVVTDPKYIIDECLATNQISTPMGCMDPFISATPCQVATSTMSIYEVPIIDIFYGEISSGIGFYDYFTFETNGNIVGTFHDSLNFDNNHTVRINLFNVYDYINLNVYEEGNTKLEVSLVNFIYEKYFAGSSTEFTNNPNIANKLTEGELLTIFPSLAQATFDWTSTRAEYFGNSIGYRAPCKYKEISINNFYDGNRTVIDYKFTNNFISSIGSSGINAAELQVDYDIFSSRIKWLITPKAYAYAVYQGILNPSIPINY